MEEELQKKLWNGHKDIDKEIYAFLEKHMSPDSRCIQMITRHHLDVMDVWYNEHLTTKCYVDLTISHCARLECKGDIYYCFFDRVYKQGDYIPVFLGKQYVVRDKYIERMKSHRVHSVFLYLDAYLDENNSVFDEVMVNPPVYKLLESNTVVINSSIIPNKWKNGELYVKKHFFKFMFNPVNVLDVEGTDLIVIDTIASEYYYIEGYNILVGDVEIYEPDACKDKRAFLMEAV